MGRDQDCYDILKWWNTEAERTDDWYESDDTYLDTKGADAVESVDYICRAYLSLSHMAAMMLVKVKLLLDLTAWRTSVAESGSIPGDVLNIVQRHVVTSSIVASRKELRDGQHMRAMCEKGAAQTTAQYRAVHARNMHYWSAIEERGNLKGARSDSYAPGSRMELLMEYSRDAWLETPGALAVVRRQEKVCSGLDLGFGGD